MSDLLFVLLIGEPSDDRARCETLLRRHFRFHVLDSPSAGRLPAFPTGLRVCFAVTRDRDRAVREVGLCRELCVGVPLLVMDATPAPGLGPQLLDAGADDVVSRRSTSAEVAARVRALLRRHVGASGRRALLVGDLEVNVEERGVRVRGRQVHLTPTEFRILRRLGESPGRVVAYEEMTGWVWGERGTERLGDIRVHVWSIRRKLRAVDAAVDIVSVPGVGYMLSHSK